MTKTPRINPHAIELLARVFNSHKKGLPEWLKNAREAYLRAPSAPDRRPVIIHYCSDGRKTPPYLECIDFVGISAADIETRFLEWANPEAAAVGLKPEEREGGQGNGGKAYLRQLFETGYFISICNGKLSVVSFVDKEKFVLDFIPDGSGRDLAGDSQILPGIRSYCIEWLKALEYPSDANVTIVRGVSPLKPIEPDRLMLDLQQFPQARETIRTCAVQYWENRRWRRDLEVREPERHPAFPNAVKIAVPAILDLDAKTVRMARPPDYPLGELELSISSAPLQGQALSTWNRVDFRATGITVVGFQYAYQLPLKFPQFANHLFGTCRLPILTDPKDNYESQGRGQLIDGPVSLALYRFIAAEADKLLEKLTKQLQSKAAQKKKKNLEKLNEKLAQWIERKMPALAGLSIEGDDGREGRRKRQPRKPVEHDLPIRLKIHRDGIHICKGVRYELRAIGYDAQDRPVPAGKVVWTSQNSALVSVHPDEGIITGKSPGIATVSVKSAIGLEASIAVQVHDVSEIVIKTPNPARVGSNRRLPLSVLLITPSGKAVKDPIVEWESSDDRVLTIGQDGIAVGGDLGDVEVVAMAEVVRSESLEIEVIAGHAGKPKGGGKGKPRILLSGQDPCPFDESPVMLDPSDPLVYQRPYKPDYENNVFWVNLQHPLPDTLLRSGEHTVQWRTYHFQRVIDVYSTLLLRQQFGDDQNLDVDQVLGEMQPIVTQIYAAAKEDPEIFKLLYAEAIDFEQL